MNSKNVKFFVSGNEKVGLYDVHITWPKEVQKMRVLVEGYNPIIVNQISGYSFVADGQNGLDGIDADRAHDPSLDVPLSILNIEDVNSFKAIVVSRPGKGGNPGMPGKGALVVAE